MVFTTGVPHVWHLRSQHNRRSQHENDYFDETSSAPEQPFPDADKRTPHLRLQKRNSCFHIEGALESSKKTMVVPIDGENVEFSLQQAISAAKPETDRASRLKYNMTTTNAESSPVLVRCRLYLMKFDILTITLWYLVLYLIMNVIFTALWTIQDGQCCDDATHSFAQIFDFAIQTSTTIGYGGYVPQGRFSNFLVFSISVLTLILNSVYAGFLFLQFVTPYSKLTFSDVVTMSNLNGFPCLELRVGNPDGPNNPLCDVEARLSFEYHVYYKDTNGNDTGFGQTCNLHLLSDRRHDLNQAVWTIRHVLDERSPLFGLRFDEAPGTNVSVIRLFISGIQEISGQRILKQTAYQVQDIMVGYRFQDQIAFDKDAQTWNCDFGKMNEIQPSPVWYPTSAASCTSKV